mmetsp:Transcript_35029/g.31572  ORF Transcript_35029/g.31572 Transcript_35029/m.31572 type:complete len:81 (-) Transcript_35029:392-634(-)
MSFYLCHGEIYQPFEIVVDLDEIEKTMFFSTVWAVISSNIDRFFSDYELHEEIRPKIEEKINNRFLIIQDLQLEEDLSPF